MYGSYPHYFRSPPVPAESHLASSTRQGLDDPLHLSQLQNQNDPTPHACLYLRCNDSFASLSELQAHIRERHNVATLTNRNNQLTVYRPLGPRLPPIHSLFEGVTFHGGTVDVWGRLVRGSPVADHGPPEFRQMGYEEPYETQPRHI